MQKQTKYRPLVILLLLSLAMVFGCTREPFEDMETGSGNSVSVVKPNVVKLDTLVFVNLVRNGQMRFDLITAPPAIQGGNIVFYPRSDGFFGKVTSVSTSGSRMYLQVEPQDISQVFSSVSIHDNTSLLRQKQVFRTTLGKWNSDTLLFNGWNLFDGRWQEKALQIQLNAGRMYSSVSPEKFWLACQGTDPWFDRLGMNVRYSLSMQADAEITAGGPMNAEDSLLIDRRLFGPYDAAGFPVTYQVDTWLGFHLVTGTDTVMTLKLTADLNGTLNLNFNYWESWSFLRNVTGQTGSVISFTGPSYSDFTEGLFVHQSVTPLFSGIPSVSVSNRIDAGVNSDITIPNWRSTRSVTLNADMLRSGTAFGTMVPLSLNTPEVTLQDESDSGVLVNQRPKAYFIVDPPAGFTDTNFEFDASGSSDLETSAGNLLVRWDFDGDNHFDTDYTTTKTAFYKYTVPGKYEPILEVKDEGGLIARFIATVEVSTSSSAPVAFFTVKPESGRISDAFLFDAYGCYDAEDQTSLLKVRWDFDGDGTWDTGWSTEKAVNHFYLTAGVFVAKLEVLDTQGLVGSTTRIITVGDVNLKPTAFFTVYPESGNTETRFTFDASGCTDPEDPVTSLQVRWDWDNDGTYDTEYRTLKIIQHTFAQPGTYTVVLEVIDTEGYGSTFTREIKVTNPNTPPDADFTIDPVIGKVGEPVTFDASISSDLEDPLELLEVRWDWDNDNIYDTGFSLKKTITKTFSAPGSYIITLQVRDSGGLTDRRVKLVTIE